MSGRLVLMGSGEIAPSMVATHRRALRAGGTRRVTLLDAPFGFQENADELTERIAGYFESSLGVDVEVASLRRPAAPELERERMAAVVSRAEYLFAGPGSPSYALRVWREADLAPLLRRLLADGRTVAMASAAALTVGVRTIPVYEIYKVGADPYWLEGLDLTSHLGLPMVVVPHWNNAEGGTHDTSRCYIGRHRFERLAAELEVGVLGIDEHTAATIDFDEGVLRASGAGEVTLLGEETLVLEQGDVLPVERVRAILGEPPPGAAPQPPSPAPVTGFGDALAAGDADGVAAALLAAETQAAGGSKEARAELRRMIVQLADVARSGLGDPRARVAGFVEALLAVRSELRREGRFVAADEIRHRLEALGIDVRDTPGGFEWELRAP